MDCITHLLLQTRMQFFQIQVHHDVDHKGKDDDLWHFRLGHLLNKVLKYICKSYNDIYFGKNKICDSCHIAKQRRLPFPLSITSTNNFFLSHSC